MIAGAVLGRGARHREYAGVGPSLEARGEVYTEEVRAHNHPPCLESRHSPAPHAEVVEVRVHSVRRATVLAGQQNQLHMMTTAAVQVGDEYL